MLRDAGDQRGLERRAAVGQVAGEQHRAVPGGPFQDRQRDHVVVQVGGDRHARPPLHRRAAGRGGDEAREADELRVELLVERLAGAPDRRDRVERARDVGAVGVVLRRVHLAARREQHDEADDDHHGRGRGGGHRVPEPRPGAVADRERGEQAEREAAQRDDADQRSQVGGDRVARLGPDGRDVDRFAVGDALQGVAVDRADIDAEAGGQADRLEAGAPVDQRDVDVERPGVAWGDRQADAADRQVAVLAEVDEAEIAARQRREDDREDRQGGRRGAPPVGAAARRRFLGGLAGQRAGHSSMMAQPATGTPCSSGRPASRQSCLPPS